MKVDWTDVLVKVAVLVMFIGAIYAVWVQS